MSLILFVIMGIIYNVKPFRSKDLRVIDILSESINNPIRFILAYTALGGSFDLNLYILLSYWSGGAFLMTCKRYAEKKFFKNNINLAKYRPSIAKYNLLHLLYLILSLQFYQRYFYSYFYYKLMLSTRIFLYILSFYLYFIFFSTNKKV